MFTFLVDEDIEFFHLILSFQFIKELKMKLLLVYKVKVKKKCKMTTFDL